MRCSTFGPPCIKRCATWVVGSSVRSWLYRVISDQLEQCGVVSASHLTALLTGLSRGSGCAKPVYIFTNSTFGGLLGRHTNSRDSMGVQWASNGRPMDVGSGHNLADSHGDPC